MQSSPVMGGDWIGSMKFNQNSSWDFNSKKLPSETELDSFFDGITTSPVPRDTGFFASVPKYDYQNTARYRSGKYPVFNGEKDSWIVPSLRELPPETILSTSLHNLIQEYKYNEGHDVEVRKVPALGLTLPADVIKKIECASAQSCLSSQVIIKNFKDLHNIKYKIENFIKEFIAHETSTIKKGLIDGNYINQNSHQDLLKKIEKIREALPIEPIFIVAEEPLLNYLRVHSVFPGELERNVWLVQDNYSAYSQRDSDAFSNYKSAIFSTEQMSGGHEFEFHYKLERGNRQWKIYTAIIAKLAMDIPQDPLQNKDGKLILDDNHPRWDRLF